MYKSFARSDLRIDRCGISLAIALLARRKSEPTTTNFQGSGVWPGPGRVPNLERQPAKCQPPALGGLSVFRRRDSEEEGGFRGAAGEQRYRFLQELIRQHRLGSTFS